MQILQNHNPFSDAQLMERFASKGCDDAFAEIVKRHLPLVLAVTRRRLGNSGLAEDAAQLVFIALSRRLQKQSEIPCLPAWLQKAAVYEASGIARRESRLRRRSEHAEALWKNDRPAEPAFGLDQGLAALPERDRQILMLHHFEKLPFAKVAQRLGLSESAAQRRGHRALEKMASILRSQGMTRDATSCALWLSGSFTLDPSGISSGLLSRISSFKPVAVHQLPWLAIAASLTLIGSGWTILSVIHRSEKGQAGVPPVAEAVEARRPSVRKFEPRTKDEDLSADAREFISRAKKDPKDAWEWVKLRPEGAEEFLNRNAMRDLADRDLTAADRFLEVIDGIGPRGEVIDEIFGSRAEGDLGSAIAWVESIAKPNDLRGVHFIDADYINSEWRNHDYAGSLGLARQPKIREWLIRQACEKASATDEAQIENLASELKGNERHIALGYAASLLLQRGDPRAYRLLDEIKLDLGNVPNRREIALRDPEALLNWALMQKDAGNRSQFAAGIWREWGNQDATAAAAWAKSVNPDQCRELGLDRFSNATVERLLKQP